MNVIRRLYIILIIIPFNIQSQDNCVKDSILYRVLFNYLIKEDKVNGYDSKGKKLSTKSEYENYCIISRNLSVDSIESNKCKIGVYEFNFSCMDCNNKSFLYFQLINGKRKYYTVKTKGDIIALIKDLSVYFKKNTDCFNPIQCVNILKGVTEHLEANFDN